MGKFVLKVDPTFKATVKIPIPGGPDQGLDFTFKHRSRSQIKEFLETAPDRSDVENIMQMATAWDVVEPFNEEQIKFLCENFTSAPGLIFEKYLDELTKAREKN